MNSNEAIRRAILAVLGTTSAAGAFAQAAKVADANAAANNGQLEEVVVTATRRSENLQNVPISIQALTGDTLSKLNVATIDDFVKYTPNVSTANIGPGQGNLYMRGLSVGALGTQGEGSVGGFPNVAVYLDEQSASLPGRNLDIYAADIERVEVLEGPQGTLFGAGAQAGVLRFITNKPKLNVTEGNLNAGYGTTAHGTDNSNFDATLNLPLIPDTLAVRAVIYSDSRGGYIDNVPSTFTRKPSDTGIIGYAGGVVPTNSAVINNYDITAKDINPVNYKGLRISGLYKINEDWDVLLAHSRQTVDAQGVFYQMPTGSEGQALNPLEVTLFNPSYNRDKYSNTAWTVNGKLSDLKLVYTGAYLTRHVDQIQDYTNYSRGVNGVYYQCAGYSNYKNYNKKTGVGVQPGSGTCYTPSATWHDTESNTNFSQEMRLSTPDDWRVRGLAGVFYQKQEIHDDTEWLYRTVPTCAPTPKGADVGCFLPIQPFAGASGNDLNVRNSHVGFFDDFQRTLKQAAAFASVDAELIPKTLTLTLGTRYYNIKNQMLGNNVGSFFCKAGGLYGFNIPGYTAALGAPATTTFGPCASPYGTNLNTQTPNHNTAKGFKSRANISWKLTPEAMIYATWSQGFRPGGFNRGISCHLADANGVKQWCVPIEYQSDDLTNLELGWKTELLDHHLQFNGSVYQETWKNVQTGIFRPADLGNLTIGLNGPDYRVRGIEMQLIARVTTGLTVQGSVSWNKSELTNSPYLIANNPALLTADPVKNPGSAAEFGRPITSIVNPYGAPGTPLANSPPFQGNIRARYEFSLSNYNAFWQIGVQHSAHSYSSATTSNRFDQPNWTTVDASLGVSKDAWRIELVGQNLTDENKSLFTTAAQFVRAETPMRPRTLGLQIGYKFSEGK